VTRIGMAGRVCVVGNVSDAYLYTQKNRIWACTTESRLSTVLGFYTVLHCSTGAKVNFKLVNFKHAS
jgi:hypothetical protein